MQHDAPIERDAARLALAIGARVRQERQAQGWTLDRLADAAGLSRRMLINVEQGAVNPSVGTLLKLSHALGIGLPVLVELPQTRSVKITRHGDGATLWSSDAGGRGELVAGTEPPDVVELWEWTLAPGDRHASEAHTFGTRELIQVQQGTVVITVGDETITLDVGDAATFPGDVPHVCANPGNASARFTLVVFEPVARTGSRTEMHDV
jgi:transcriptional regulator with XRE-family HTH domain